MDLEMVHPTCLPDCHDFEAINQHQTICRLCGLDMDALSARQPVGEDADLVARLQKVKKVSAGVVHSGPNMSRKELWRKEPVNPDGPEAAIRITALLAENERMAETLGWFDTLLTENEQMEREIEYCSGSCSLPQHRASDWRR